MPTGIPTGYVAPKDGVHTISVRTVETKMDGFGKPQEVATCAVDGNEEQTMRAYFPHGSKKWFDQGVEAGLIGVSGENWEVIPGQTARVLIQGGKIVQYFKL